MQWSPPHFISRAGFMGPSIPTEEVVSATPSQHNLEPKGNGEILFHACFAEPPSTILFRQALAFRKDSCAAPTLFNVGCMKHDDFQLSTCRNIAGARTATTPAAKHRS